MKKILLLASLIFSATTFASAKEWSDLELYNDYKVTQDIVFENGVVIPKGEAFELRQVEPLSIPGYPMFYMQFHQNNCQNADQTAELSIMNIGSDAVGVELEEGCNVGLYLEFKYYYNNSSFE